MALTRFHQLFRLIIKILLPTKKFAMTNMSRIEFLTLCSGLTLASFAKPKRTRPPLSFSTLGCPDWSLDQIIHFASTHGYKGVEIRGVQREMDLPKSKHFA